MLTLSSEQKELELFIQLALQPTQKQTMTWAPFLRQRPRVSKIAKEIEELKDRVIN